jgi:uncharacterized membrane protein YczE
MRAVRNKKVQKAAVHLALTAGISAYNKKKYGTSPLDGVRQAISSARPTAAGGSSRVSTRL